eukprot:7345668-Alexandrium_andersonii.AAC.1
MARPRGPLTPMVAGHPPTRPLPPNSLWLAVARSAHARLARCVCVTASRAPSRVRALACSACRWGGPRRG